MQEVTASHDIDATPEELSARLDPPTLVEAEGSFTVESVHERADATVVAASGPGLQSRSGSKSASTGSTTRRREIAARFRISRRGSNSSLSLRARERAC